MKLIKRTAVNRKNKIVIGLLTLCCMAGAQQVFMTQPPSESPINQSAYVQSQTNEMQVFSPAENAAASRQDQPFQWGPLTLRPHISYQFLYGDGIESSPSNHQTTVVNTISPGILIDLGTHWALDYTPTLAFYSNNHFRDTFNNSVVLMGGITYEDWKFSLSQSYVSSSAPTIETGTQTDEENYLTALNASYAFNSKMSLDMGLYQNLQFAKNLQNSRDWSTLEWLNYEFWPRLNAGIGAGFGYLNVDTGSDQTHEQLQGRVNWRATDKISFQVAAGFEERQFLSGGGDLFNPVFSATVQYQPFETTRLSLTASRTVSSSVLQNQLTENTGVNANLNQRFFKTFFLDLGAGYNSTKYVTSVAGAASNRTDDYYSLSARLTHAIFKRGTVSAFYQYANNSSSQRGFGYSSSQIGVEAGYSY